MSGAITQWRPVPLTGSNLIDAMLYGEQWIGRITYAFPATWASYGPTYPAAPGILYERDAFVPLNASMQTAVRFGLEGTSAANVGFSVEGFTAAVIEPGAASNATIRAAMVTNNNPQSEAYAFQPASSPRAGDT